jgi:glycerol uptake operon antiterminator
MGLHTVLRFFIVDSQSVTTTVEAVRSAKPDLIEIMPGIVPKIVGRLKGMVSIPIVAGGLIETEEETCEMLKAGAFAVSTGRRELWNLKIDLQ